MSAITLEEAKAIVDNINKLRSKVGIGSHNHEEWTPLQRERFRNSALKQENELKERLCDPDCTVDLRLIGMTGGHS